MRQLSVLIRGEFKRLIRYKLIQVGFGVSILWVMVMFLIGPEEAGAFVPMFIFMDVAMMTVLLIGASFFYERQENTLKSMLTSPASMRSIIASKMFSAVYIALQSSLFIGLIAYFFFNVDINFFLLIPFSILIAFFHAMIGYTFAVLVEDFPALLALMMAYMILFGFPSLFYALGLLSETLETILLISPTHASMLLIDYAFYASNDLWIIALGIVYLLIASIVLSNMVVFPKYIDKAIKE